MFVLVFIWYNLVTGIFVFFYMLGLVDFVHIEMLVYIVVLILPVMFLGSGYDL